MPQFERYPGENPATARKRIAKNKAKRTNPSAVKTKSDMMAENIMPSIKNMGY
jgi:hypothetical protein